MSKRITIAEIARMMGVNPTEIEIVEKAQKPLGEYNRKDVITLGNREYIVCGHLPDGKTILMTKKFYLESVKFDSNSPNYKLSSIREDLKPLYHELKGIVGEENICKHTVDLTTHNGFKDFGEVEDYISLPTFDFARNNIDIFYDFKDDIDDWGWLANAWGTPETGWTRSVCVVTPGCVIGRDYYDYYYGARAFCVLKSSILVS